jgi:hypothetical protein
MWLSREHSIREALLSWEDVMKWFAWKPLGRVPVMELTDCGCNKKDDIGGDIGNMALKRRCGCQLNVTWLLLCNFRIFMHFHKL